MFRFFRKVRFKFLTESRIGRYLVYAIGEIILVVVGILIALSINNWNGDRKERKVEQEILKALRADFEANKVQLAANVKKDSGLVASLEQLKYLFTKTQAELLAMPKDSIRTSHRAFATFNPTDGALNNLFNSGQLGIITNDTLRSKISNWPNVVKDTKEDENIMVQRITTDLRRQHRKYHSYQKNEKFKVNRFAMFDDMELQNTYLRILTEAKYQIFLYHELDDEIDEILAIINREIKD